MHLYSFHHLYWWIHLFPYQFTYKCMFISFYVAIFLGIHVSTYVHMYRYRSDLCLYVYMHLHVIASVHQYLWTYAFIYAYMHVLSQVSTCVVAWLYGCIVCAYVCMCWRIHIPCSNFKLVSRCLFMCSHPSIHWPMHVMYVSKYIYIYISPLHD